MKMNNREVKKKTLIITHSVFGGNYGGILQAFALQRVLKGMGLNVSTDAPYVQRKSFRSIVVPGVKYVLKIFLRRRITLSTPDRVMKDITVNTSLFATENMNLVDILGGKKSPSKDFLAVYSSYVVGSDQVWRSRYCDIPFNMLNFVSGSSDAIKISYAASFGKDDLTEYSPRLIKKSSQLIKNFDAVSVREKSGVDICSNYFGIAAVQSVDPTLLLDKQDYLDILQKYSNVTKISQGGLFAYVLDRSSEKRGIIESVASIRGLDVFEIMPLPFSTMKEYKRNPDAYTLPHVAQWLRSFHDAEYIVTDSFHGCVFSIIFNKPFIAIGNKFRGLARFTSLLSMFDLKDRLVTSLEDITEDLVRKDIDWVFVNEKIRFEQKRSFDYLKKYLG